MNGRYFFELEMPMPVAQQVRAMHSILKAESVPADVLDLHFVLHQKRDLQAKLRSLGRCLV